MSNHLRVGIALLVIVVVPAELWIRKQWRKRINRMKQEAAK